VSQRDGGRLPTYAGQRAFPGKTDKSRTLPPAGPGGPRRSTARCRRVLAGSRESPASRNSRAAEVWHGRRVGVAGLARKSAVPPPGYLGSRPRSRERCIGSGSCVWSPSPACSTRTKRMALVLVLERSPGREPRSEVMDVITMCRCKAIQPTETEKNKWCRRTPARELRRHHLFCSLLVSPAPFSPLRTAEDQRGVDIERKQKSKLRCLLVAVPARWLGPSSTGPPAARSRKVVQTYVCT